MDILIKCLDTLEKFKFVIIYIGVLASINIFSKWNLARYQVHYLYIFFVLRIPSSAMSDDSICLFVT